MIAGIALYRLFGRFLTAERIDHSDRVTALVFDLQIAGDDVASRSSPAADGLELAQVAGGGAQDQTWICPAMSAAAIVCWSGESATAISQSLNCPPRGVPSCTSS